MKKAKHKAARRVFHVTDHSGFKGIKESGHILATGKGVSDDSTRRAYVYHNAPDWVACDVVGRHSGAKIVLKLEIPADVILHEDDNERLEDGRTYSDIYGEASYSNENIPCVILGHYPAPVW